MKIKSRIFSLLGIIAVAMIIMGHKTGISGQTGSPSETTCARSGCHTSFALNSGPGSILISHTIPATGYVPGQTYSVSVTVAQSGFPLFGFDLEALTSTNTNAGTLLITSSTTTQILTATSGRKNITHKTGGGLTSGSHTFSFNWKAPVSGTGNVTFFAAGAAANNNNSDVGDYIYSTSVPITETTLTGIITGPIAGSSFCEGQTGISIPYLISGTYTAGNVFTAQLSDAAGLFASPMTLGTLSSTAAGAIITSVPLPPVAGTLYRIRIVSSTPSITGSDNGTDLTINLLPTIANAGPDQTACGTSATFAGNSPASGNGIWSLISGSGTITSTSSSTSGVTGLGAGNNIFKWTITTSCGTSADSVIITGTTPATIANAGPDQNACTTSAVLAGNNAVSGIGQWTLVGGSGAITDPSDPLSSVTGLGAGADTFRWTISNLPCAASFDDVIITQGGTITIANAGSDQTICSSNATLSGNTPVAGTGNWSIISGSGIITTPSDSASAVSGLAVGANTFRWTISNGSCTPSTDDVIINVSAFPTTSNAGPDQVVCTSFATLSGNVPISGSGLWTLVGGAGTITSPSNSGSGVTGLSLGANTFRWTISNSPCSSSTDDIVITRSGTITVANAGTDQTICGSSGVLSGNTAGSAETGLWTLVGGSGTITSPSSPVSAVTSLGTGYNTFRWTISNGTCVPTTDDITITSISPPTIANAGPDQSICATSAVLAGNIPIDGTGVWSVISGSSVVSSPGDPGSVVSGLSVGINKFVWTISNSPCLSSDDTIVIFRYDNPTTANAGPDQTICSASTAMAANAALVGIGSWSIVSGSGTFSNSSSPTTTVTSLGTGVNVFQWMISNGTCASSISSVTITNCNTLTIGTITGSPFCSNTSYSVMVPFTSSGTFTGFYTAELSDSSGNFGAPIAVAIGSSSTSPISAIIPSSTVAGNGYRIRVTNSSPYFTGTDNGVDLEINTCLPLLTGTITGSPFCQTTSYNVSVPFSFFGSFTGPFIVQLSDASGSFGSPITIGYGSSSPIAAVIPSGTPLGIGYRIRISDLGSGFDGEDNGSNLIINNCSIGIGEYENDQFVSIYPNPAHGNFNLLFNEATNSTVSIELTDVLGTCKLKKTYSHINQNEPQQFELSDLEKGFYLIRISAGDKTTIKRLSIN